MFKPDKNIQILKHQSSTCRDNFNLLCWNIAKLSLKEEFKIYLKELIEKEKLDFLLLQEVKNGFQESVDLEDYSYVLSINIQTRKYLYGVLSAFKIACAKERKILTYTKELSFLTHKSSLFTLHPTERGKELLVVNLHAINFVTSKKFGEELNYIKSQLSSYKGSLIIGGDFNAWSKKRVEFLEDFTKDLELKKVNLKDDEHTKKVFKKTLDFVFYRGLTVKSAKTIKCDSFSDHNPLIVNFELNS